MFDARIFRAMKTSAFVINVGRGAVVNEAGLIAALQSSDRERRLRDQES
jgi:phosphoglycerate dehydrogenase-like enzyme